MEFSYVAPDQASANSLKAVLDDRTDYVVRVEVGGGIFSRTCVVTGSTRPTALSPDILDQWVDWMVIAGLHQNCEFDGWGAQL